MNEIAETILKSIVDLINTSSNHRAWLDPHYDILPDQEDNNPMLSTLPGYGTPKFYIQGPLITELSFTWGANDENQIMVEDTTLKIGPHQFDLNDPKSIIKIEQLFECDMENTESKKFNPIDAIESMMK